MTIAIYADKMINLEEFIKDPLSVLETACGEPLAVFDNNKPVFYCVSAQKYGEMMEVLEDAELGNIVYQRVKEKQVRVKLEDL